MKFCSKCGIQLELEQNICPQCGYDLSSRQNEVNNTEDSINNIEPANNTTAENSNEVIDNPNQPKKKLFLSKGAKISLIGISIIGVLLVTFFIIGNSLSKPSKVVLKFQNAITSNNKSELVNMLYCNDNRLEIKENNISPLLDYFKDNPSYLNREIEKLNKEAVNLELTKKLAVLNENNKENVLNITSVGKKFLFFPNYKICIKPSFIEVKTSIKDVTLSLNGREIGKSDIDNYSKEFGPFVPGKYELVANYKGKYVTLSEPNNIDFITNNTEKVSVDIFNNLNYVNINSKYPEAELFVNGSDAGIKVADAKNFGPLNNDTKIYATIVKEGKILKSTEYTVNKGDSNIYLDFTAAENRMKNAENKIHDLIYWYTHYFTLAVNTGNFSLVENYIYPGSQLYNEQKNYIPTTYEKGIKETIMSFNVISYTLNEDNTSGTVTTEEVYKIDNNGSISIKTFKYKYTFKYNEAKERYQLSSISKAS